jgi:predicted permease
MSLWSRIINVFRGERVGREIDEELQSHMEEAMQQGRDPAEVRRSFGPWLQQREESRDMRVIAWLDSLRADAVFGWRQLKKKKVTSAAAILSLALAIGSCTSAFRLIDAVLLRPLPVAHPEQLYALSRQGIDFDGKPASSEFWAYPAFTLMRVAVKNQAELLAISFPQRMELTYKSDQEMEKAHLQYVSGWMFSSLGLRPALGRLLTENDDLKPGAHPYTVLSHDYWTRRFGQDPKVIGRTFRMGKDLYEVAGVVEAPFTGTEPGTVIDIFVPTMMNPAVTHDDWTWHRTLARLKPGVDVEPVRAKLHATSLAFEEERAKSFAGMSKESLGKYLAQTLVLKPAAEGASGLQKDYGVALATLGVLVALVLLIACANVANLMSAQAAARAREMALRVSIGAGPWRLLQLVLVESAILALLATAIGGVFAWWSAPFVVSMINPTDNPARLDLPADWRVLGFGVLLTLGVTFLFGLAPALRASAVQPVSALKGGEDPHSRRRLMHMLIAVQASFCFLVLFVAGLFVTTFERLSNQPTGFSAERLLTLDVVTQHNRPTVFWYQVAAHLRTLPGVESVALAGWPLLSGTSQNGFIGVNGAPPGERLAYFLNVSPGWIETMKIPLMDGRDFRASDTYPGTAIVNEAFAKEYFHGENPVGKWFYRTYNGLRCDIVGLVRDAQYRNVREPIAPTAYIPLRLESSDEALGSATFLVRTARENPLTLAPMLRQEVRRARSEFRVSNIRTQKEINQAQMVRERLLAMLALFFAVVALVLAAVGLYGVLDYSVLQRRREIGIRMALGAQAMGVARLVTVDVFAMVLLGAIAGVTLGMACVRYIESLFYQVKPTDLNVLLLPALTILAAALLAALPAVIHAVRIDPVKMLRAD